jgi:hypothetical protein
MQRRYLSHDGGVRVSLLVQPARYDIEPVDDCVEPPAKDHGSIPITTFVMPMFGQ